MTTTLLDVTELAKRFPAGKPAGPIARLRRRFHGGPEKLPQVYAVDDVSFTIAQGETVGLVGESGCGKSTLVRVLTRLLDPSDGGIKLGTRELSHTPARRFARDQDRKRIQMVFQDAGDSVNPRFTAFEAIADPLRRLRGLSGADLRRADLPPCRYSERCPRKLSSCDQPLPVLPPDNPHTVACWNPL
jgi:ABC-type glutathione transport system ATPase component